MKEGLIFIYFYYKIWALIRALCIKRHSVRILCY